MITQEYVNELFLELRMNKRDRIIYGKGIKLFDELYENFKEILEKTEDKECTTLKLKWKD